MEWIFLSDTNLRAENPNDDAIPNEGEHQEQEVNKRKGDVP